MDVLIQLECPINVLVISVHYTYLPINNEHSVHKHIIPIINSLLNKFVFYNFIFTVPL